MSHSMYDKERVYLAYRALFFAEYALLRKEKNIKKLVEQHKRGSEAFIKSLGGVGNVVTILKPLLKAGVFGSEAKAKKTFPSLFRTSAEQDERHSMAEASTAKMEAEALVNAERMEQVNQEYQSEQINGVDGTFDDLPVGNVPEPEKVTIQRENGELAIRSLYPSYVPFRTQHLVLASAQRLLEECCFDFTGKWAPYLIDRYGWDCPEAIELNKWTQIILKRVAMFPEDAFNHMDGWEIPEILASVHVLRHSAVHRLHTSTKGINQMILSATIFTYTLRDADRQSQLAKLYAEMEGKITVQELNKNFLEEKLASELDEVRESREALDRREQEAIYNLLREDNENKSLVGSMLEESVRGIFNLPEASAKHDELPDEAGIYDSPNVEGHGDDNSNIEEKAPGAEGSVRPGDPFSPLPEEPILEEEPIPVEEVEPIPEPPLEEVPDVDKGLRPPAEQCPMDELSTLAGERTQANELAMEDGVVSGGEFIFEAGTTHIAETVEEPVAEKEPAAESGPVIEEEPCPEEKPTETSPTIEEEPYPEEKPTETSLTVEEAKLHANCVLDFNEEKQATGS